MWSHPLPCSPCTMFIPICPLPHDARQPPPAQPCSPESLLLNIRQRPRGSTVTLPCPAATLPSLAELAVLLEGLHLTAGPWGRCAHRGQRHASPGLLWLELDSLQADHSSMQPLPWQDRETRVPWGLWNGR